ncbi:hypothetical protein BD413DRAFT_615707 [Trametes elegans]|nr:hypothetical protein BD413DRAFT_615707 [Trametes elegans]
MSGSDVLLVEFVRLYQRQTIHSLVSSVWLLYDLLTTFDREVEFVWKSANTFPKLLYLVSSIYGTNLLPLLCAGQSVLSLVLLSCMVLSIEMSLMLRIDALYGRSRTVRILIMVAFGVEISSMVLINVLAYPQVFAQLRPFPSDWPIRGCFYPQGIVLQKVAWIPILLFEMLLFCLNTIKCRSYAPLDHTPLIYCLFRDGIAYFVIAFAFMLVCMVASAANVSAVSSVAALWISAVLSYSGCHLLLSVRSVAAQRQQLDLSQFSLHASQLYESGSTQTCVDGERARPHQSPPSLNRRPRVSLHPRAESIELIPRSLSLSLHLPRVHDPDSSLEQSSESYASTWTRHSDIQSDSPCTSWLEHYKP